MYLIWPPVINSLCADKLLMCPIVGNIAWLMSGGGRPDLPPLSSLSPLVASSVTFNSGNNVTQYTINRSALRINIDFLSDTNPIAQTGE